MIKATKKYIFIACIFALFFLPLFLYFVEFHGALSDSHSYWAEFAAIWDGTLGTLVSALTVLILINDRKENDEKQILQRQLELYYKQIEKLSLFCPSKGKENCFTQFNERIADFISKHYKNYLYNFYSTDIAFWPQIAFECFVKAAYPPFGDDDSNDVTKLLSRYTTVEECFLPDNRRIIQDTYNQYFAKKGINRKSFIESIFKEANSSSSSEPLSAFTDFIENMDNVRINTSLKNLYIKAFNETKKGFEGLFLSYFSMHKGNIDMLKNIDEALPLYFSQVSGEEKKCIIYYLLSLKNKEYNELHIKNKFITENTLIYFFHSREKIISFLRTTAINKR